MNKLRNLILMVFLTSLSYTTFASHVAGGYISYSCTNTPNRYKITMHFFRDCSGINAPGSLELWVYNDCGLPTPAAADRIFDRIGVKEVSQLCDLALPSSECNGGNQPGVEEHIYEGFIELSGKCDAWHFGFKPISARNNVTNTVGGAFYMESTLNNAIQTCNNSPEIKSLPIPYFCTQNPATYDYGVLELDGDSLVYKFTAALIDTLQTEYFTHVDVNGDSMKTVYHDTIEYNSPFTLDQPIFGIKIDSSSGFIDFTPTSEGQWTITIIIEEYNCFGDLIGTVMHDIQTFTRNCVNKPPLPPAGITNFNSLGTNAIINADGQIKMCTGDKFCFDVTFTDPDAGATIRLRSLVTQTLPGAVFTTTGTNPATGTVCWEYTQGYTANSISIITDDQVCPIPGVANFVIGLDIPPALFPGGDSTFNLCRSDSPVNLHNYIQGYFEPGGQWQNNGKVISAIMDPADFDNMSGDYYYVVKPDPSISLCGDTTICADSSYSIMSITIGSVDVLEGNIQNESCEDQFDGIFEVTNVTGDAGPFIAVWFDPSGGFYQIDTLLNGQSTRCDSLYGEDLLDWHLVITDSIGCLWQKHFKIEESTITLNSEMFKPDCYGDDNGSIILTISAGANDSLPPNTVFDILNSDGEIVNDPAGSNVANNIPAGWYSVTFITRSGCEDTRYVELKDHFDAPVIPVIKTPIDVRCNGDFTGAVYLDTVFNHLGSYDDDLIITWAPSPTGIIGKKLSEKTNFMENLPAGEYVVKVLGPNACFGLDTFYINEPIPLIGNAQVKWPTFCRTAGYQVGSGEVTIEPAIDDEGMLLDGSDNPRYTWKHTVTEEESHAPTFNVDEPGWLEITMEDDHDCVWFDSLYVDSINPIAAFDVRSLAFHGPGQYEGTEDLKVNFINKSRLFTKDTINWTDETIYFRWNKYTNDTSSTDHWKFIYDPEETVTYEFQDEIEYQVCLVTKNFNDCRDTACVLIKSHDFPVLTVPNVFTPSVGSSTSSVNDYFFFPNIGILEFDCTILNRYGVEVFHFTDINDKWDGTNMANGKACNDGVYFFSYTAKASNGTPFIDQGNVHLLRGE